MRIQLCGTYRESSQIVANEWWALVPRELSPEIHEIFARRATLDPKRSTDTDACYFFGAHSDGTLALAWGCFLQAQTALDASLTLRY